MKPWLVIDPEKGWDYDRVFSAHETEAEADTAAMRMAAQSRRTFYVARLVRAMEPNVVEHVSVVANKVDA